MSSFELCKSTIVFPMKELKNKRMMRLKSDLLLKAKNKLEYLDNFNNKSQEKKNQKIKCITISNEYCINRKNLDDIKIPQLKLKDKKICGYKKITFFSINNRNNKKNLLFQNNNKKNIKLNGLFHHKSNFIDSKPFDNMENIEKNKININDKIIELKDIRFKRNRKNYTPNIFNSKNGCINNIQISGIEKFQTRNKNQFDFNQSPSHRIYDNRKNKEMSNLKDRHQNNKLKLDFGLINLDFKNPELRFKKIEKSPYLINTKILNEKKEKKESNISENNKINNSQSYKDILSSEKRNNNFYLNYNKNEKKRLFKIKIMNKFGIPEKNNCNMDKKIENKNSLKLLFNRKLKKKSNIKIILESKGKSAIDTLNEENNKQNKNKDFPSDIKEIKLKPSAIKDINIIKKNLNKNYIDCEGTGSDIEKKKLEKYDIGDIIGKGSYATIKVVKNKNNNEKYAMKIYDKLKLDNSFIKNCIKSEIEVLKLINHKNISKLIEDINTETQIIIIQELIEGFSLRDYYNKEIKGKKNISSGVYNVLKKIFKQIFEAMNYLHQKDISHRDIKLENILMSNNYEVKIIDFGFGLYNPSHKKLNFFCGTPKYIAPEIINGNGYLGEKVDLWSLGVLIYKIYCDNYPFKGRSERELYCNIKKGKYKIPEDIPTNIKNIIINLIVVDPIQRINCEMVLQSPWLNE